MTADLHDRTTDWLLAGATGTPPRDLAVHASSCPECLRAIAVTDALGAIDVGAASAPPYLTSGSEGPALATAARVAIGAAAAVLLVVSALVGTSGLLTPAPPGVATETTETEAGDVLAGAPSAEVATPTERPTPSQTETPTETPSTPPPSDVASPPPTFPPAIAPPLPAATPTPAPPTVAPTAAPTPPPPPTLPPPTPTVPPPTPTPVPDDCVDGIDNDGDTLVDALDPGCTLNGNEDGDALP